MAAQFDTARVILQPTQQEQPTQTNIFDVGASVFGQQAAALQQSGQAKISSGLSLLGGAANIATSAFDRTLDTWNKYAEERASRDAAGIISRDGNKQLIPPSSFYPPGISTRAYAESYRKNAEALYRSSAESDYQNYSEEMKARFPGDVAAYSDAMKTKRQSMLAGLDDRFAPYMDLRFQQIEGATASQIAVRVQSDTNTRNKELSDREYNALVSDGQVQAAWATKQIAPGEDPVKHAEDVLANAGIYSQRWADYVTKAKAGGMSDAQIQAKRDELAFNVAIHVQKEAARGTNYDDGKGNVDGARVAADQEAIHAFAQRFPGREKAVEEALTASQQEAITRSSRAAQGQVLADKNLVTPQIRSIQERQLQAQLLPDDQWEQKARIQDDLRKEALRTIGDKSLSDSVAMTLSAAYMQAGTISRGALQESNDNRIGGIRAVINDPAATAPQKATAYENAQAIRNDPEVFRNLTPGQRAGLQDTMDGYVRVNYGAQLQASNAKFLEGGTSPPEIDRIRAEQVAKGIIQPHEIMQVAAIDAQAKANWHAKNTQSSLAAQGTENFVNGNGRSPEQVEAQKKELAWKPPGGGPFNAANPDHIRSAQELYQKHGIMPDAVKAALDVMVHSPNEADIAGQKALFNTIRQVERQQVEKKLGTKPDENKERLIAANVEANVGGNYSYLANAAKYGAAVAAQISIATGSKPGQAGRLGQTADQNFSAMNTAVDSLAGMLQKSNLTVGQQLLADPMSLFRSDADATPAQKALKAATGVSAPGGFMALLGLGGEGNYESVQFGDNLRNALVERGTIHAAHDGDAIKATLNGKGALQDSVVTTAFVEAVRNGEISAIKSADGKSVTFDWKTLGDHVGPAMNIRMTPRMTQNFAASLMAMERFRTNGTLTEIDPERVSVSSYQSQTGQMFFRMVEQDRNGNYISQENIAKDDPRIALQALSTVKAATQAVLANAADPSIYGAVVLPVLAGPLYGPALVAADSIGGVPIKYPIEGQVKMGAMVGSFISQMQMAVNRPEQTRLILGDKKLMSPDDLQNRKNMLVDFQRRWNELDAELKKNPNAPGLKEAVAHMIENHAPGLDTPLRQLIKDSGYYQPGRLPQATLPQPPASRIGKDER